MTNISTNSPALQSEAETAGDLLDDWFDRKRSGYPTLRSVPVG
jgi:hypothetical protein